MMTYDIQMKGPDPTLRAAILPALPGIRTIPRGGSFRALFRIEQQIQTITHY